jgi:hypothetical protein
MHQIKLPSKDTKKIRLKTGTQDPQKSDHARPKKSRVTRRKKRVNGYNADLKITTEKTYILWKKTVVSPSFEN